MPFLIRIALSNSFSPRKRAISSSYAFLSFVDLGRHWFCSLHKEDKSSRKRSVWFCVCVCVYLNGLNDVLAEQYLRGFLLQHLHVFARFRQDATFGLTFNTGYAHAAAIADFDTRTIRRYDAAQFHDPMIDFISPPSCRRPISINNGHKMNRQIETSPTHQRFILTFDFIVCGASSIVSLLENTNRFVGRFRFHNFRCYRYRWPWCGHRHRRRCRTIADDRCGRSGCDWRRRWYRLQITITIIDYNVLQLLWHRGHLAGRLCIRWLHFIIGHCNYAIGDHAVFARGQHIFDIICTCSVSVFISNYQRQTNNKRNNQINSIN